MNNIVIFGATGTLGVYTAIGLKSCGYNVTAVGRRKSDNGFFKDYGIMYYSVDINNPLDFSKISQVNVDSVLHFAGIMPATMNGYDPQNYISSVMLGTYNVLEFCRKINANKIIFTHTRADSSYLMGTKTPIPSDIEKKFPLKGDHSIYAICKNAAVDLIEHYFHEYGLNRFILRLPTIYGYHPNKYFNVNGLKQIMAFRLIMEKAMASLPIEIWGDPTKEKEIIYVKDFVRIVELAAKSELAGGVYNVGRGIGVSLEEQILGIADVFSPPNKRSEIVYKPDKPDGRQFIHDISKTKVELGFEPEYGYRELLIDFKKEMELNRFNKLWGF